MAPNREINTDGKIPVDFKTAILMTFIKSGSWALLCFLILLAIWYEGDKWLGDYVRSQQAYVVASAGNISALQHSTETIAQAITQQAKQLAATQELVQQQYVLIKASADIMAEAQSHMKGVPERSAKQMEIMSRIERTLGKIEELLSTVDLNRLPQKPAPLP